MIVGLKPYPKMKDSGVPWLGELPEHWGLRRLKASSENVIEQTDHALPGEIYVALEHVEGWTGRIKHANEQIAFDSQVKRFRAGDVLFGKLRPYLAKVTRAASDGVCVGEFLVLRTRDGQLTSQYLEHVLRSRPVIDAVASSTFGAKMPRADWGFIGNMLLPHPPAAEQEAIVRFLEHAGGRIRRYIGAKQKLIKLLEEQRQAIIHRAVTRGLDPNVRLKPSGVEWLGDIPEQWEVESLKHLVPEVTVGIVVQPARHYVDDGIPCLRSLNISGGSIRSDSLVYISPESNSLLRKSQVFAGDVVIVRTGNAGVAAVVTPEFNGANCIDLLIVRRSERLLSEYLHTYLNSWAARTDARFRSVGAIQAHYNTGTLANLLIPVPPQDEQQEILDSLSSQLKGLTEAQIRARSELRMLRELRDRLIADVVTGKLDVRRAALRLSDEQVDADRRGGGERHAELVGQRLDQGLDRTEG